MQSSLTIEPVGLIPIGSAIWDDFEKNKQKIIDFCLSQEKPNVIESGIGTPIKGNLWESKFDFLNNTEMSELNSWCYTTITAFTSRVNKINQNIAITESWCHVTNPGGWHGPHRHPWSAWSGIFYVSADDEENGYNTFHNFFDLPKIPGYEFWEETFKIPFKPGQLVIFPSTMLHYATPYLGNDKRIVIALNSIVIRQKQA
jgi:hypothetical protein